MKYRKKPVVINAWLIGPLLKAAEGSWKDLPPEVRRRYDLGGCFVFCSDRLSIKTLEGTMIGAPTDWLIQGVNGEFYPCKPDIFAKTYEVVDAIEEHEPGRPLVSEE